MKKLIAILLVALMCLSVLAACTPVEPENPDASSTPESSQPNDTESSESESEDEGEESSSTTTPVYDVEAAAEYLDSLYKNGNTVTASDYKVFGQVMIGLDKYTITWSVDNELVKAIEGSPEWTIDVDEKAAEEHTYKLTGTITAPDGTTATVSYDRTVPKYVLVSFEDYMAAEEGTTVVIEGIVVAMNGKSVGNSRNHLFLADASGKGGYYCYQLDNDPVAAGVQIGMTVSVTAVVTPYSGMQETKGGTFTIVDETIKDVPVLDITEKFAAGESLKNYVGLVVTIKGVTIGTQDMTEKSQYLYFSIGEQTGYVRTYVTDFPTTLSIVVDGSKVSSPDKITIDEAHAANFGNTANATGILVLYNGAPYLIPMTTDCFSDYTVVTKTDADKVKAEADNLTVIENVTENTTVELPLVGKFYDDVKIAWTIDNEAYTIDENGKLVIALADEQVKLTLTATVTCGEVSETKTFEINVKALAKGVYTGEHVDTPVAGTAYKFYLTAKDGKNYYFNGIISGKFLQTSTNIADGVDVYLEAVLDGETVTGYRFYFDNAGVKTYIDITTDGKATLVTENPTAVFNYVAETNCWATTIGENAYYLGTYSSYTTIGASATSYIKPDNTGVSQFPANFAVVAVVNQHVCEFGEATCTAPATCACGKTQGEALGHKITDKVCENCGAKVVTVTEAAALEDGTLVLITATVSQITYNWSDSSKNMSVDITDGTTTLNAYKLGSKVGVADEITIYGKVGSYKGTKQIVDATATVVTAHTCTEFTEATCDAAKTCKVCGKADGEALGHNYVDGTCSACGAVKPASTTYAFADYEAGVQYAANEVHKLDDNVTVTTTDCHFTSELRIYFSEVNGYNPNGRNGVAVFAMTSAVKSLSLNAGGKAGPMAVYGSTDGETWTPITTIDVTSNYTDYDVELGETAYTFIKLAATESQVRVKTITIELA